MVVPDILANSSGVTTSYFEWVQDRYGYFWTEKEVNERLEAKMCEAFAAVLQTSLRYKVDMRTAAYIVAISRVATVTRMRGKSPVSTALTSPAASAAGARMRTARSGRRTRLTGTRRSSLR